MTIDDTWIDLKDAAPKFGMSYGSAKNAVLLDRFPVRTYKVGRRVVIDRQVMAAYFEAQRIAGMKALEEAPARPLRRKRISRAR